VKRQTGCYKEPLMTSGLNQTLTPRDAQEIDLKVVFSQLWAGKFLIAGLTAVAGIIGLFIALGAPPTYRADALLQLEEKSGQLALPSGLGELTSNVPYSATEIEIIRSRMVLGQAAADAQVAWSITPIQPPLVINALLRAGLPLPEIASINSFVRDGEGIRLDLLEVPAVWLGKEIRLMVGQGNQFTLLLPDGEEAVGQVDKTLSIASAGFALRIGAIDAAPGREFIIRHLKESTAVNSLRDRLSVSERGRGSGILELSLTGPDTESTRRTLNAIAQAYIKQNISRSAAEAESSLVFVEGQLPEAEARVRVAESALNQYRQQRQAIDLGFEAQSLLTQISNLETQLQQLVGEEELLTERYTPNHPVYQQNLNAQARLVERLEGLRAEIANLPETQREVLNLSRDLELAQSVYTELLGRSQELNVLRASSIGNVRIVDTAYTQELPIAPRKSRILALSLLLGIASGVAMVLLHHALRRGIQSAEEISALGLPVLATLNLNATMSMKTANTKKSLPLLALSDPEDLTVEGLRSLRTSLHFAMLDAPSRSITITSAAPEAGKSFTAANLSVVTAQSGQTVCIVDCDLRRGHLRRYFDVPKSHPGLSEYLSGNANLDEILIDGPVPGLKFISTGQLPPNPSELLMRPSFRVLVSKLNTKFDLSIFDSPPVLAVTDPILIGQVTGATLAVVRFDKTRSNEITALQLHLEQGGVRLTGAALNGFDPRRAKPGYSYGYTHRYHYERADLGKIET
jgi:tyrosine-protein kinase Etk/Wzc